eukprot:630186-Hanusia_phi.AAC.1
MTGPSLRCGSGAGTRGPHGPRLNLELMNFTGDSKSGTCALMLVVASVAEACDLPAGRTVDGTDFLGEDSWGKSEVRVVREVRGEKEDPGS